MRYFPFFFDMRDKDVLVVGGGIQASSKVRLLVKTEARITLVSPDINDDLKTFHRKGRIDWLSRLCQPEDFVGRHIVYVATHSDDLNARLGAQARAAGALVAAVDQAEASDILTPALVDRDPVIIAIGTEGSSPVLSRLIKARIDRHLPFHLGRLARWAGSMRVTLENRLSSSRERRLFWSRFFRFTPPFASQLDSDDVLTKRADMMLDNSAPRPGQVAFIRAHHDRSDLLTLRALHYLHDADLVLYDEGTSSGFLEHARREARLLAVSSVEQGLNAGLRALALGEDVIRLVRGSSASVASEVKAFQTVGYDAVLLPYVDDGSAFSESSEETITPETLTKRISHE